MVIIWAIVFLKRAPYPPKLLIYTGPKGMVIIWEKLFLKKPPPQIHKKISPDKRGHVKIN
jgi:hypothetical protein